MDNHVLSVFAVQASVTLLMISFCMVMLVRGSDAGVYLPVMTGITGFWFPSPLQIQGQTKNALNALQIESSPATEHSPVTEHSPAKEHSPV